MKKNKKSAKIVENKKFPNFPASPTDKKVNHGQIFQRNDGSLRPDAEIFESSSREVR
ncbi:MAG: hypothetical protein J6J31_06855 [Thermoguttaceae bacterium]|nr:hypothetical protein [Thermoguttaceae bacterium]